jgi:hypothetical protein
MLNYPDKAYSIWRAGKGDRFSVAAKGFEHPVLGYVLSNGNGTWSIEHKGENLPYTYSSMDQAATALITLASKRASARARRKRAAKK